MSKYIIINSKNVNLDEKDDKNNNNKENDYYEIVLCENEENKEECSLDNIFSNKKIWVAKSLFIFDKDTKDCKWKREENTPINPSHGEVFYVTCKGKKYVMKIVPIGSWIPFYSSYLLKDFKKEVHYLKKASKYGIAPKIIQVYLGEEWGIIVMEDAGLPLWIYTENFLKSLYKKYLEETDEEKVGEEKCKEKIEENKNIIEEKTSKLSEDFYRLYKKLHHLGICHNDLALRNITYSEEKDRMYFIDYGYASDNKDCRKDLMEFFDDLYEYRELTYEDTVNKKGGIIFRKYFWVSFLYKIDEKLEKNKDPYYSWSCSIL